MTDTQARNTQQIQVKCLLHQRTCSTLGCLRSSRCKNWLIVIQCPSQCCFRNQSMSKHAERLRVNWSLRYADSCCHLHAHGISCWCWMSRRWIGAPPETYSQLTVSPGEHCPCLPPRVTQSEAALTNCYHSLHWAAATIGYIHWAAATIGWFKTRSPLA